MRRASTFTSCFAAAVRAAGFGLGSSAAERRPDSIESTLSGIDEHPGLGRNELGRAPDPRRDHGTLGRHAFEERDPERLDKARLTEHVAGCNPGRDFLVRKPTGQAQARDPCEALACRAVADERERPAAEPRERLGEPDDVLPLVECADAEEVRLLAPPVELAASRVGIVRGEPLEVDAGGDDLDPPVRLGELLQQLARGGTPRRR